LNIADIYKNFDKDRTGFLDFNEFGQLVRVIAPKLRD